MSIVQAIRSGILNVETVQSIQDFPTICPNPNWTFWHQLKHFFAHYTRDADAPIRWDGKVLILRILPMLHPSVRCSRVHANRVLRNLRGGNIQRIPFREQILSLLVDGEKKAAEVIESIDGNPKAIYYELKRLVDAGEIVKVKWGIYALKLKSLETHNENRKSCCLYTTANTYGIP